MSSSDNPQFEPQEHDRPQPPEIVSSSSAPLMPDPNSVPEIVSAPIKPAPIENPVWSGWDVLAIVGIAFFTILVSQFVILFGAKFLFYPRATLADLATRPLLLLVSQFVIDGAVGLYMVLLVEGKYHVRFWNAIRWNWPRSEWKLLVIGAGMLFFLTMLESILPMPKETPFEKLFERPRDAYLLAIIAVTLGPLVEELFFRGLLYPVIARRWGAAWGVFLTALPFALMHMPQYGYAWGALVVVLIIGVVCGVVRAITRSVGASFIVHVGYNGTQMLIAVVATQGFRHMEKAVLLHL